MSIVEAQPLHTPSLRRSSRVRNVPLRYGFIIENNNASHIIENDDLMTYSKAVMSSDFDKWLNTMKSKIDFMDTNQVWTLLNTPESVTLIGYKWVFKRKIGADGQEETYKVRLVAKSCRQK